MADWFSSTDFWTNFGPIMFDEKRWAEAPVVAQFVKDLANLKDGSPILDAGCGVGRISVELAALGLDVTGVDLIQSELDTAKETAEAEGVKIDFVNADLRNYNPNKKFDCAVNLFTSFGYCDKEEDDLLILKNIYNSLNNGGTFILECTSRETAILYFTEGEWFERAGFTVLTEFTVVGAWEGLNSKWILIDKEGHRIEHEFVQRLYSAAELCKELKKIGFSKAETYGDFDKSPYDQNARTMVIIAIK